ncbi:MAG: 2-hydroxychromene-2-carboxylate isomerase, partial [Lautropia sp.]
KAVEFLYDFVSTPSYIAWKALVPMLDAVGATLVTTPIVLTGIQKATGNPGPMAYPAKMDWVIRDMGRWCTKRGVYMNPTLVLPFRSLPLLRGSLIAAERGEAIRYMSAMFDAIYIEARDFNDPNAFAQAMNQAGLNAGAYLQGIERDDIKDKLRANTNDAVTRKVFGTPTFFVNGELFFGQDRLEFVMDALQGI